MHEGGRTTAPPDLLYCPRVTNNKVELLGVSKAHPKVFSKSMKVLTFLEIWWQDLAPDILKIGTTTSVVETRTGLAIRVVFFNGYLLIIILISQTALRRVPRNNKIQALGIYPNYYRTTVIGTCVIFLPD